MSLNAAIDQKYVQEVEALLGLLLNFITSWKSAPTQESKLLIESEAVTLFERILALDIAVEDVKVGEHPVLQEIVGTYKESDYLFKVAVAKLKSLAKLYLQHYNSQQILLQELIGKLKRIRQKQSALALWTLDEAKYVVSDHFLNYDSIGSEFVGAPTCDVDVNQGLITLPIRNKTKITPSSIRIGSTSNGLPGNSNIDVTTNNTSPAFATNGDVDNWFEYERLDSGPLRLTLTLELSQEQIVNNLSIEPINLGRSLAFEVEDVLFNTSSNETLSIRQLLNGTVEPDFFTIKSIGNDTAWHATFLPVFTKTISIKFKQTQPYSIDMLSTDDRKIRRLRYAIALKDISLNRLRFEPEGGLNSLEYVLPTGLYAVAPFADIWPQRPQLFDLDIEMSFDGGETWVQSETLDDGIGTTLTLGGVETGMLYRLKMIREDDNFANIDSLLETSTNIREVKSMLRTVSRFSSPVTVPLAEKPKDNRIFCLQPQLARRGDRYRGIRLGEGQGTSTSFALPVDILNSSLDIEDVHLLVNKRLYSFAENNTQIGFGEWSFSDDYKEIEFSADLPSGADVQVYFDEEILQFEERSDGYYHQMDFLFDPDKGNIEIKYLPRRPKRDTMLLSRSKKVIGLGAKNLLDDKFSLSSKNGATYNEVTTRADLATTMNAYYVDYVNGVLYLGAELDDDLVKANFSCLESVDVPADHFDIVYVENQPWGIRISKEHFAGQDVSETISNPPFKRVNVRTGRYVARSNPLTTTSTGRVLSHDCIVVGSVRVSADLLATDVPPEEVDFIDGFSEFLGLIPMKEEATVAIESGANYFVEFNLNAGNRFYSDFPAVFEDSTTFATFLNSRTAVQMGNVGEYYVGPSGLVTVNIGLGATLIAGSNISYYYQDPTADPTNKFSVDYQTGTLYSYTPLVGTGTVSYKAACYKAAYDIAQEVDSYSYEAETNSVSVRTEGLSDINSLVKVIWTETKTDSRLDDLKEFFTPMISVLGFRFT